MNKSTMVAWISAAIVALTPAKMNAQAPLAPNESFHVNGQADCKPGTGFNRAIFEITMPNGRPMIPVIAQNNGNTIHVIADMHAYNKMPENDKQTLAGMLEQALATQIEMSVLGCSMNGYGTTIAQRMTTAFNWRQPTLP